MAREDACSATCPGYDAFDVGDGEFELQRCDDCFANLPDDATVSDADVRALPAARRLLRDTIAREGGVEYRRNPAWSTRAIAQSYDFLEEQVAPAWLPKLRNASGKGAVKMDVELHEYGCGAYGCVLETLDPKVTTDQTEAEFAAELSHLTEAVVRYLKVIRLPNEREGRTVFLVWRESAEHVGELEKVLGKPARRLVDAQHEAAQAVYDFGERGDVTSKKFDQAVENWRTHTNAMATVGPLEFLSAGLLRLMWDHGVFLGDIHAGNLGMVTRGGRSTWVVTDPGHTLVVNRPRP